jgi:hypothetical protein
MKKLIIIILSILSLSACENSEELSNQKASKLTTNDVSRVSVINSDTVQSLVSTWHNSDEERTIEFYGPVYTYGAESISAYGLSVIISEDNYSCDCMLAIYTGGASRITCLSQFNNLDLACPKYQDETVLLEISDNQIIWNSKVYDRN